MSEGARPVTAAPELEVGFEEPLVLSEGAALALEDYARALTQAEEAWARRLAGDPARVSGVRLQGPALVITAALTRDIEDFARALTLGRDGPGLGWS
jgi:hypothetical protein